MPPTGTIACNDLGGESGYGSCQYNVQVSFGLSATANAGNAEAVNTQLIRLDTTSPRPSRSPHQPTGLRSRPASR